MTTTTRDRSCRALTAAVVLAMVFAAAGARAATHVVDTTIDEVDSEPGDGRCATAAGQCTLRAAIQEAGATPGADTIVLPTGRYRLAIAGRDENDGATGDLDIHDDLTIRGDAARSTLIDGDAIDRVLDIAAPGAAPMAVTLEAVTVRGGRLDAPAVDEPLSIGAGLRVRGNVLVNLVDVDVRDNIGTIFGGGVGIDSTGCIVGERVRLLGNRDLGEPNALKPLAGAVRVANNAQQTACLRLDDVEIADNHANDAGAVYGGQGVPITIRRGLVRDNTGRVAGAFLLNQQNIARLENVTITGNRGNYGVSLNDGGSTFTLIHCTVTGNGVLPGGGNSGAFADAHGGFGLTFLGNSIVAGNGPGFFSDDVENAESLGGNIIGSMRGAHFNARPDDQLAVDPQLAALDANGGFTATIVPGAPAIDRADDLGCPPEDQRGEPRPRDGNGDGVARCDIGAFERDPGALFANGFEGADD